ncbi:hypothetical protein DMH04_13265 [Kibdelosporangium aridum]|uniref:Lipoprotein n=1 Tax=Kibdelosporangium aridum TaxID=2030 RepID=A0A428ZF67_KIBAR|nr:hypothetical protein [Kibdelosporangium aridum]RSM86608.1 hypothetical protein DMH04_13265 [Kibdelosporangium aridum]
MARKQSVALAALVALGLTACTEQQPEQQDATGLAVEDQGAAQNNAGSKSEVGPLLLFGTAKMYNVPPDSTGWAQLQAGKAGALNSVLVDANGMTLYRFDNDTADPPQSNCDGDCATSWPPVTVAHNGRIFLTGVEKSDVGVVRRADGFLQVTVAGWPVYRHVNDKKPGDTKGQGAGRTWFGITPTGKKAGTGSTPPNPVAGTATLFDGPNFSESSQDARGKGCQNLPRPKVTSSVSATGWVTLWSEKGCTGRSLAVSGKIPDLTKTRFDDIVASVSFD